MQHTGRPDARYVCQSIHANTNTHLVHGAKALSGDGHITLLVLDAGEATLLRLRAGVQLSHLRSPASASRWCWVPRCSLYGANPAIVRQDASNTRTRTTSAWRRPPRVVRPDCQCPSRARLHRPPMAPACRPRAPKINCPVLAGAHVRLVVGRDVMARARRELRTAHGADDDLPRVHDVPAAAVPQAPAPLLVVQPGRHAPHQPPRRPVPAAARVTWHPTVRRLLEDPIAADVRERSGDAVEDTRCTPGVAALARDGPPRCVVCGVCVGCG